MNTEVWTDPALGLQAWTRSLVRFPQVLYLRFVSREACSVALWQK